MATPLSDRQRTRLFAGLALLALIYFLLVGREFTASVYAARPELPKLERAVYLSPGNADYRHRLGRYQAFIANDPLSAIASFQSAVKLNPYDAHYWFDLAGQYQIAGNITGQRAALEHALQTEPTAPDVAWEAANFFLVDGEIDRALHEFSVVIANDNSLVDAALQACWRVRPDAHALLQSVIPARTDSLLGFLSLLVSKEDTAGAMKTWERLSDLHEKFEARYLFDYVRYLIAARRPDAAMAAWEQAAGSLGLSAYLPTDDNLVVNGDFSLDILNGGFDWTYVNRLGVRPLLDASDFRQGRRSLSLTFEGPGINDAGVEQLIPVHGAASYDFLAYYKSADFEGAGGPEIVVRDAYTGTPLFVSDPLTDADFWKEVHSKITTSASTTLVTLAIERFPAGSPIRGKLWLNDFQLSPDDSSETSPETSSDAPSSGSKSVNASLKDKP
jgi:tetratricopeptide (TPR) repeat protein